MLEIDEVRYFIYCYVYVYIGHSITCCIAPPCVATCVAARNCQKIHKTPYFGVQGHWIRRQSRASVRLPISD